MGKLICDSTTSSPVIPWKDPTTSPSLDTIEAITTTVTTTWETVSGLEDQQKRHLQRLHAKGVLWKPPGDGSSSVVFRLSHGGDVDADGNCLFTASRKAMWSTAAPIDARELRRRTVRRFLTDLGSLSGDERSEVDAAIKHMYSPDLKSGWGVHVVQVVKLLAKKQDRDGLDSAIDELVHLGMQRELEAESIYKERDVLLWMTARVGPNENREGRAAAFGDDIAIECLATEFKREIFVVQAHGSDAMVDEENCVFFLPHRPRGQICELPFFLFMKGTGWCGAGGDHYEPLIAHPSSLVSQEKVALVL
ncbi:hypothetical protein Acr_06g0000460 [Actinidia rufa]|uniref:Uncharacterized protein n=1 Tax=Actinidia rufa TaxID=165716 RepID=A0A7J0EPI5_9ERIC|nr:hypothetical protein Acr_06g0000460 [Actinidia rufa]